MNDSDYTDIAMAPHSTQAEEALLGALLINPDMIREVAPVVPADDFFILRNQWIYAEMVAFYEARQDFDQLTLHAVLAAKALDYGGMGYMHYLQNSTVYSHHAVVYAELIHRMAERRRGLELLTELASLLNNESIDLPTVKARFRSKAAAYTDDRQQRKVKTQFDAVQDYLNLLADRMDGTAIPAIGTGIKALDKKLTGGGLKRGQLVTVAGKSGHGKSTLLYNLAVCAAEYGQNVAFFSFEMQPDELIPRLIATKTGINTDRQERPQELALRERDMLFEAAAQIAELPINYEQAPGLNAIVSICEAYHLEGKLDVVIVDYVQRVPSDYKIAGTRNQELAHITAALKGVAMNMNCLVIQASQLNDKDEMRESGDIRNDSDIILLIKAPESTNSMMGERTIRIEKQRNGWMGDVDVFYNPERLMWRDLEHHRVPDSFVRNGVMP